MKRRDETRNEDGGNSGKRNRRGRPTMIGHCQERHGRLEYRGGMGHDIDKWNGVWKTRYPLQEAGGER